MEGLYGLGEVNILRFLLVMMRIGAFVGSWPILSGAHISPKVKVLFAGALTVVLFPVVPAPEKAIDFDWSLILFGIREVSVGLVLGLGARFFFQAFSMAGAIVSHALGLGHAQVFNPSQQAQSTVLEEFYLTLASLFFFALQGHHMLLKAIFDTYKWIPLGSLDFNTQGLGAYGFATNGLFTIALNIAAPMLVAVTVIQLAMSIVGRAVPQINVFIASMPVLTLVGLFLISATIPALMSEMPFMFGDFSDRFWSLVRSI